MNKTAADDKNNKCAVVGVMSDSHYDLNAVDDAVCAAGDVDCWFHAGDSIDDAGYLEKLSDVKDYKVPGNVDWFSDAPPDLLAEVAGLRIFMTHGHRYGVKFSLDKLKMAAKAVNADIVIYGHSHVGAQEYADGRLFINPGSVSEPRDGLSSSFMKIIIINGKISVNRIFLNNKHDKF